MGPTLTGVGPMGILVDVDECRVDGAPLPSDAFDQAKEEDC